MGTTYSIVAYAPGSVLLDGAAQKAFDEIDRLDALLSHYRPNSEICTINRTAHEAPVEMKPKLFALLDSAIHLSEETGGAFDITVGPLMKIWGFFRRQGRVPGEQEIAQTLQCVGYQHIQLDEKTGRVGFDRPGMEIDLGAIGKGYAVDRVVEVLRARGVARALVSSGGSTIAALGVPPGKEVWEVALYDPYDRRRQSRTLQLRNMSLSVSGGYEQMFVLGGRAYSHLLDPRSGRPVEGVLMTAVIGGSAMRNDAMSTSFFVLGAEARAGRSAGFHRGGCPVPRFGAG